MATAPALPPGFVIDDVHTSPPAGFVVDANRGQYGSGGMEDTGTLGEELPDNVPDGATDIQRDEAGHLISYRDPTTKRMVVAIAGNATPAQVAGVADGSAAAGARGLADTITFGTADELGSAAHAAMDALSSDQSFGDAYDQHIKQIRDVMGADEAEHPTARLAGQLLGGFANIPVGLESVGLKAGTEALRAGADIREARAIAAQAITRRMAAAGAAQGAAYGAGSGTDTGERLLGAVEGGVMGAGTGFGLGKIGEAAAPRLAARAAAARALPLTDAEKALAAADRANVVPFAADIGGPGIKRMVAGNIQTPFGSGPLTEAANATVDSAKAERSRIAAAIGSALDPEAAGENIRTGVQKAIDSTRTEAKSFYSPAEKATAGVTLDTPTALAKLDEHITELDENPAGEMALSTLQALRDRLAKGGITVRGLRGMRTSLRDQFIKEGLRGSDVERRVNQVVDAAADDINTGLSRKGLTDAASNFRQGDTLWKKRVDLIDNVFTPLVGTREKPKSGEAIVKSLTADLQGNNARAARLLRSLPEEEANNARASIIAALGHPLPGAQDATGGGFLLPKFLTDWNKIGPSAKKAYFGEEARAALNDLATVAGNTKEAMKYAGHSNSGGIISANLTSGGLGASVVALLTGHPLVAAASAFPALNQAVTSRVLASPRFVRWLARAPKSQLSNEAYLDRLTRIVRAEPAIANDLLGLQSRLSEAMHPERVAAQKPEDRK